MITIDSLSVTSAPATTSAASTSGPVVTRNFRPDDRTSNVWSSLCWTTTPYVFGVPVNRSISLRSDSICSFASRRVPLNRSFLEMVPASSLFRSTTRDSSARMRCDGSVIRSLSRSTSAVRRSISESCAGCSPLFTGRSPFSTIIIPHVRY